MFPRLCLVFDSFVLGEGFSPRFAAVGPPAGPGFFCGPVVPFSALWGLYWFFLSLNLGEVFTV